MTRVRVCCLILFGALAPAFASPPASRPVSIGVFTLAQSQPYQGAGSQVRVLPFVSYRGEHFQWFGPFAQVQMTAGDWTFSTRAKLDFGAYDEGDSEVLRGLGDRDNTLLLGLGVSRTLVPGWECKVSADRDVLGVHDGLVADLALSRNLGSPRNRVSGSVSAGYRYLNAHWMRERVGVPTDRARSDRPAYDPGDSLHPVVGGRVLVRLGNPWVATAVVSLEMLDATWTDSPLVGDDWSVTTFATLAYTF